MQQKYRQILNKGTVIRMQLVVKNLPLVNQFLTDT